VATSIYDITTIDINIRAVLTNTAPTGPYRGAGRPEAIYMIERVLDAGGKADRDRSASSCAGSNMVQPSQMPYTNCDAEEVRHRQLRSGARQGAGALADWPGSPRAKRNRSGADCCAGAGSSPSSNGPAPMCSPRTSR
jgi:carbon-monoxide dehydrogenase large subunit